MKSKDELLEFEKLLLQLENLHSSFDYLKISLASPNRIKNWSERILPTGEIIGEILKPETINFRTHQPEINGLFCEKIFGPIKNWKCKCGKYNGFIVDKICEECNVELVEARVRRYRMGYIDLACPIAHLWYLKGVPNYLCILLRSYNIELKISEIENIIYFKEEAETIKGLEIFGEQERERNLSRERVSRNELKRFFMFFTKQTKLQYSRAKKRRGAEVIKSALEALNLTQEIKKARNSITNYCLRTLQGNYTPDKTILRRIRILESFLVTKTNPSWMILTILPVLPPHLRPLLELENGRLVSADVNEIYRLIITRNQRLFDFLYNYIAPEIITTQGRKLLQESVDSLIDNARVPKEKRIILNNNALKSLTEILEGKQGRFRQSLLGKRVDYSGRSVIVVGPNLRLNQCGLPYEMAKELFKPFLINELLKTKIKAPSHNTKLAHIIIKKNKPFVWSLLIALTKKYSVLLNRAPTLHRFGIQAFDPVLVLGQAIHLHPLVCTGFNADFDGDQMAVHLPLYESSQLEIRTMMRPSYNVLSPATGEVVLKPTQDMVIGCYYLTLMLYQKKNIIKKWFPNETNALSAFYQKKIDLHTPILVRYPFSELNFKIDNNELIFLENNNFLNIKKKIIIYKSFEIKNIEKKYYLLTNIGILIARSINVTKFKLTDLFLETSPGRLLFSINFKNALK
jgi:DNA-directed RNA polymerase subunit beta'